MRQEWRLVVHFTICSFLNNIVIDFSFQQAGTTQLWVRARLAKLCPINTLCGILVSIVEMCQIWAVWQCFEVPLAWKWSRAQVWRMRVRGGPGNGNTGGLGVPRGVSLRRSLSPRCVLALMIRVFTLRNRDPGPLLRLTQWWVLAASNQDEERQTTIELFNWEERLVFNWC